MSKDKSANSDCSKFTTKDQCYKDNSAGTCYWGEDPATQCKPPSGTEPPKCAGGSYWDTYRCEYQCKPTGFCKWDLQPKDGPAPTDKINPCYIGKD
jgi:hypothetical protein